MRNLEFVPLGLTNRAQCAVVVTFIDNGNDVIKCSKMLQVEQRAIASSLFHPLIYVIRGSVLLVLTAGSQSESRIDHLCCNNNRNYIGTTHVTKYTTVGVFPSFPRDIVPRKQHS